MTTGFQHELSFWEGFIQTDRFKQNWISDTPNPELQPESAGIILAEIEGKTKYRVLDLGSGVVSILRGTIPTKNLTACDPLADKYREIFDYDAHKIKPPDCYQGENLGYKDGQFDVVHISNAIDHTENPAAVLSEMERTCKKGGLIIISGFVNEGEHERYKGLHQWNARIVAGIDERNHVLDVNRDGKKGGFIVNARYGGKLVHAETIRLETGRDYFIYAYRPE